jgi:hypothetical protein
MQVYFAMLTFVCALATASLFLPERMHIFRNVISFAGYSAMCIFIGLRDQVGGDWYNYLSIFQITGDSPLLLSAAMIEPMYAFCNKLVYLIGGDIHIVNLLCAAILLSSLFNFSRLIDTDSNLILFISTPYLLFVVGMNYTRQSVAIGLCLNAIGYFRKNRHRMFFLMAIFAFLFHYSAAFMLILGWINSVKRMVAAVSIAAIAALFFGGRYATYASTSSDMQSGGVWSRILIILIGLLVILVQRTKWRQETQLCKLLLRALIILMFITPLCLFFSTLVDRICLYLFFVYILGIGNSVKYAAYYFRSAYFMLVAAFSYGVFIAWFGFSPQASNYWFPYGNSLCNAFSEYLLS